MNKKGIQLGLGKFIVLLAVFVVTAKCTNVKVYGAEDPNKITRQTFTNYRISSLTIGAGVDDIEAGSFNNLHYLSNINVDENNSKYSSFSGCLYNKDQTELVCFPQGLSSAYIPNTCIKLAPGCLAGKSASLRRQVKAAITANNDGTYPEDYPGYEMDQYDEYDRYADPTIPASKKKKTIVNDSGDSSASDTNTSGKANTNGSNN